MPALQTNCKKNHLMHKQALAALGDLLKLHIPKVYEGLLYKWKAFETHTFHKLQIPVLITSNEENLFTRIT